MITNENFHTELRPPVIKEPDSKMEPVQIFQPVNLTCDANGVPPPELVWYKVRF